jgi:hypothetical protein
MEAGTVVETVGLESPRDVGSAPKCGPVKKSRTYAAGECRSQRWLSCPQTRCTRTQNVPVSGDRCRDDRAETVGGVHAREQPAPKRLSERT